jgi:hypothetical protein
MPVNVESKQRDVGMCDAKWPALAGIKLVFQGLPLCISRFQILLVVG